MREDRRLKLKALMKAQDVDYIVLVVGSNLNYFTGLRMQMHERPTLLFIHSGEKDAIFLPKLEWPNASSILKEAFESYAYTDEEGPHGKLKSLVEKVGIDGKKIGVEFFTMRVMEFELLRRYAPHASYIDGETLIAEIRMCKDEEEISLMGQATAITEESLKSTLKMIRPGVTEEDVAKELKVSMFSLGSGELWKQPIVTSGPRTSYPHAKTSKRVIEAGDLVMIDTGATYEGYTCDLTRTFGIGQVDEELRKIYQIVKKAVEAVIQIPRAKFTAEELDREARQVITRQGYGEYFIHRTGHGLGLEGHEPPYVVEGNKMEMRLGMTFTVEPGIYLPGRGGVRIEDNVVVTGKGLESITRFPRELTIL